MRAEIESKLPCSYALIRCDGDGNGIVPRGFPVLRAGSLPAARRYRHLFVLCSALHLPEAAKFVSEMNRERRLQALFVRTDVDPELMPQMMERAGLRSIRNVMMHSSPSVPRRVLDAWRHDAQAELIAHAAVAGDRLIVVSCEPKTYEVRFDQMPALRRIAPRHRGNFEISEDGSFIWWPSADVHLDLDAMRTVTDTVWRNRAKRVRQSHGREYGAAIAALRRDRRLRQTDIGGLSERQLRRVEESGAVSVRTMELLAKAHGMALGDYLDAVAHELRQPAQPKEGAETRGR